MECSQLRRSEAESRTRLGVRRVPGHLRFRSATAGHGGLPLIAGCAYPSSKAYPSPAHNTRLLATPWNAPLQRTL